MKNSINKITLVLIFLGGMFAFAQQGPPPHKKIKSLKVAFLTGELELTSEEAQAFWPIYNAHEEKMEDIRHRERMQFGKRGGQLATMTEAEASKLLASVQQLRKEKQQIEEQFVTDLKPILPSKKILLLFRAEESFKRRLIRQYRDNRGRRQ